MATVISRHCHLKASSALKQLTIIELFIIVPLWVQFHLIAAYYLISDFALCLESHAPTISYKQAFLSPSKNSKMMTAKQ
jgi:hypothetical protein